MTPVLQKLGSLNVMKDGKNVSATDISESFTITLSYSYLF